MRREVPHGDGLTSHTSLVVCFAFDVSLFSLYY